MRWKLPFLRRRTERRRPVPKLALRGKKIGVSLCVPVQPIYGLRKMGCNLLSSPLAPKGLHDGNSKILGRNLRLLGCDETCGIRDLDGHHEPGGGVLAGRLG